MVSQAPGPTAVQAAGVGVQIGERWLLSEVSMALPAGSLTAFVGPNGAGKSTMLSVLSGDRVPETGEVLIGGRAPRRWSAAELARWRSVMRQEQRLAFAFSVAEVVAMGRMPHRADPESDRDIVRDALRAADLEAIRDQDVTTLSGGEAARSGFARTLAQTAPVVLLDEPTAALDLRHQEALLGSAAALRDLGCCVVIVLHDLNLAARYADRVIMFAGGRLVADGEPAAVLTAERIAAVYHQPVHVLRVPGSQAPLIVARPTAEPDPAIPGPRPPGSSRTRSGRHRSRPGRR